MTRFLKMSLSIAVLMLVAVLVLTSCGKEEVVFDTSALDAEIDAAKAEAQKAQEAADAANDALRDALSSLQTAIIEKADAETLNAKIAELTAALDAAKAASSNANAELYKALEELEATKVTLDGVLMQNDIYAVNAYSYAARYELALDYNAAAEYSAIYETWSLIEDAYAIADHNMLRAITVADVDNARAAFDDVMYNNRNAVDVFADDIAAFDGRYDDAKKLFEKGLEICGYSEVYEDLVVDYYDGRNLIQDALSLYVTKVNYELDKVAGRVVVYPTEPGYGKSDADEISRLATVILPAANDAIDAVKAICSDTNIEVNAASLKNFEVVYNRYMVLAEGTLPALGDEFAGAEATAKQIAVLYNADVFGAVDSFVVNAENVAAVNDWFKLIEAWKVTYLVPAQGGEAADRYAFNYALIAENEALLNTYRAKIDAVATDYKTKAQTFQILVSYFYDLPATADTLDNLLVGVVDAAKVTKDNAAKAEEMNKAINAWRLAYPEMLPLIYAPDEKVPDVSFEEAVAINALFADKNIEVAVAIQPTIAEALEMADDTVVVVSGIVKEINTPYSEQYKNITVTIVDAAGNSLYLYRLAADVKLGDAITVTGKMATYREERQMAAGATAVVDVAHTECVYTTLSAKCDICGVVAEHDCADADGNKLCDACGIEYIAVEGGVKINVDLLKLAADKGYDKSENPMVGDVALDDVVTMAIAGGNNSGKVYDESVRVYATDDPAGTITFTAAEGYSLAYVKVFTVEGTYAFLQIEGDEAEDLSNEYVNVNAASVTFNTVKNGSSGKQVRVTAVEVIYVAVAA